MRDRKFIKGLSQVHIGNPRYAEKSKARIRKAWEDADKLQRETILYLCGTAIATVYRAYLKGRVTAKLICAMSQELKMDPHYLLGKSDTQRDYTDGILVQFLRELGYEIYNGYAKKRKLNWEPNREQSTPNAPVFASQKAMATDTPRAKVPDSIHDTETLTAAVNEILNKEALDKLESLTMEDMEILLRGIFIQAAISPGKKTRLNAIKYLLSS